MIVWVDWKLGYKYLHHLLLVWEIFSISMSPNQAYLILDQNYRIDFVQDIHQEGLKYMDIPHYKPEPPVV